jgi:hypothetical protein
MMMQAGGARKLRCNAKSSYEVHQHAAHRSSFCTCTDVSDTLRRTCPPFPKCPSPPHCTSTLLHYGQLSACGTPILQGVDETHPLPNSLIPTTHSPTPPPHLSVVPLEVEVHALPEALSTQQGVVQANDLRTLEQEHSRQQADTTPKCSFARSLSEAQHDQIALQDQSSPPPQKHPTAKCTKCTCTKTVPQKECRHVTTACRPHLFVHSHTVEVVHLDD